MPSQTTECPFTNIINSKSERNEFMACCRGLYTIYFNKNQNKSNLPNHINIYFQGLFVLSLRQIPANAFHQWGVLSAVNQGTELLNLLSPVHMFKVQCLNDVSDSIFLIPLNLLFPSWLQNDCLASDIRWMPNVGWKGKGQWQSSLFLLSEK